MNDFSKDVRNRLIFRRLQSSIGRNDQATFECLITKVSNGTIINKTLFSAAQYGNLEMVRYLIESANANVNAINEVGETPIFGAIYEGHLKIVNYLLSKNANVNTKGSLI